MAENQQRDKILTPFVERLLSLQGNRLPEAKRDPSFQIEFDPEGVGSNKISIIVWPGVNGDDGRQTPIRMHCEPFAFSALALHAQNAPKMEPGTERLGFKVKGPRKKRPGDESKGPAQGWDGTVFVGKDAQGVCYLCVMAKGAPKLKFPFRPSNWTEMVNVRTGEPASQADVSCDYAEAWSNILMPIVSALMVNHPFDWKSMRGGGSNGPQARQQQQQQRSYNGGGASGGDDFSYPSGGGDTMSFDEEIPM